MKANVEYEEVMVFGHEDWMNAKNANLGEFEVRTPVREADEGSKYQRRMISGNDIWVCKESATEDPEDVGPICCHYKEGSAILPIPRGEDKKDSVIFCTITHIDMDCSKSQPEWVYTMETISRDTAESYGLDTHTWTDDFFSRKAN